MANYPKKPKAPKQSASLETWQNYEKRVKEWEKKCRAIDQAKAQKKKLIGRLRK